MKKSEAQELARELNSIFRHVLNTPVTIAFDKHEFDDQISEIIVDKIGTLINAPDKEDGKTPTVISLLCEDSKKLVFVYKDISIAAIADGMQIEIGDTIVKIRRVV